MERLKRELKTFKMVIHVKLPEEKVQVVVTNFARKDSLQVWHETLEYQSEKHIQEVMIPIPVE